MEIMQVSDTLICTFRVAGLDHMHLRILVNNKGKKLVAVDPVGARKGNWVFTASGSAEPLAVKTQLPFLAPTGSTATSFLPLLFTRMRKCM